MIVVRDSFVGHLSSARERLLAARGELQSAESALSKYSAEFELFQRSQSAMKSARQLLTRSALSRCESLATHAVQEVFGISARVIYDMEAEEFVLDYGEGRKSNLTTSQSGGVQAVVSFVFMVFLILRRGCRRVLFMDESWTQVSDGAFERFLQFVKRICGDFGFEILLISHDVRISDSVCDRVYEICDGHAVRTK